MTDPRNVRAADGTGPDDLSDDGGMIEIEPGKLVLLLAILITAVVLGVFHVIDSEAITGTLGGLVGYATGNGRLASKGWAPQPLIRRRPTPRTARTRSTDRNDD